MSKIALDLTQFRSAGVYTVEIDNSERISVTTQSLRLVPGFSAQGPYNTPVFIRSTRDLERFYGPLDTKLERRGSYFHRSIQTCLLTAPVFALNLLKVDDDPESATKDEVQFTGLRLDASKATIAVYDDLFVNFFNRQRFWTSDPDYLQGVVTNSDVAYSGSLYNAPLFQVVNLGNRKLSFIIRKAQNLSQYSVYAKDWYGSATNIPYEWIREYDYIKDYFIQVIAIEGDWTNYTKLSTDPYYSTYFNINGIIVSELNNFINSANVNLIGSWTGCIIPDFKDQTGVEQYIETVINAATALTGILVNVNQQALDQLNLSSTGKWVLGDSATNAPFTVDLVGHNLMKIATEDTSVNLLSYNINVSDNVLHASIAAHVYPTGDTTKMSFYLDASANASLITVGSFVKNATDACTAGLTIVTEKWYDGSAYIIETAQPADLVSGTALLVQKPIDDASLGLIYKFIKLDGLALTYRHLPGYDTKGAANAEEGVEKIYGMLEDSGINRGLLNPDMIDYRYVVDTMAYGLRNEMGGKAYLSRLAKARGKTTAIISAPSIAQFATSTNPYFCETFVSGVDPTPIFSTEYIAKGGNPDMPRSFKFSFPTEVNGSKYCGVFGPFLKYNEGGKLINIPPAADVANAYVKKFLGGNPFAIVANRNGILSNPNLAGVEYMIDKTDRDYLEPFGYNSIIERPSTGQVMIYCNTTAFQDIKSDFNNLHVRELLNTLELQIEEVLKQYIFDFNNAVTRLNIINSITPILETTKDAGALTKYDIVMDETNNTADVIADGFGIIDIGVWVTGALTKIVNRITVNKNAGTASGGFIF
jgi:hypothetical protein